MGYLFTMDCHRKTQLFIVFVIILASSDGLFIKFSDSPLSSNGIDAVSKAPRCEFIKIIIMYYHWCLSGSETEIPSRYYVVNPILSIIMVSVYLRPVWFRKSTSFCVWYIIRRNLSLATNSF